MTYVSSMPKLIGIAGALRKGSFNAALLRAVKEAGARDGIAIEIEPIHEIPLYDGDLEAAHGIPGPVRALQDRIAGADGLLLATPEYNNSIPGVLKNAIDWLSRPPHAIARVFRGKTIALIGASAGQGGTALAQAAWLPVLRALETLPFFGPRVMVSGASKAFDTEGALIDDANREKIAAFTSALAQHLQAIRAPR